MAGAVAVWLVLVAAANIPGAQEVGTRLLANPGTGDVTAALVAGAFVAASLVIWSGALNHFQVNTTLTGSRRRAWAVIVWGFFVFGGLAYYIRYMGRLRETAA